MKTLVVIPAKNLEATIADLIHEIRQLNPELDVLVVNDGSTDGTSRAARDSGATVIDHPENLGKGAALRTGFEHALEGDYEAVITMDGDGQHDPAAIPGFLDTLDRSGADIVVGTRMHAVGEMPKLRVWTNRTTSRIVSFLARQSIPDSQSGYRIFRARVLKDVLGSLVTSKYDMESEVLIRAARRGFRVAAMAVKSIYTGAVSHIHPVADTLRFLRLVARSPFWR